MENSLLDSLRAKPVPAKQQHFKVQVPEPDKKEDVELLVPIQDRREESVIDRHDILKRIEGNLRVQSEITDDTIRLKPVTKAPKKSGRQTRKITQKSDKVRKVSLIPDPLKKDNLVLLRANVADVRFSDDMQQKIPKSREKVYYRAPAYYQNNREKFIHFINSLFSPYQEQLKIEESNLSGDSGSGDGFSDLLTHQKIVRDYINVYTPYRGLLLYHGLGSGKTCSSIAIAEGLKDRRKIWVMKKERHHKHSVL